MVMINEVFPIRVMGRHVDSSCNVTLNVSLDSCTVLSTMSMIIDPEVNPLLIVVNPG